MTLFKSTPPRNTTVATHSVIDGEIVDTSLARQRHTPSRQDDFSDAVIRWSQNEVILRYVPANARVEVSSGSARILVLGDVHHGAAIHAKGGGARIDIMGRVHGSVHVYAEGAAAHILVSGRLIHRQGSWLQAEVLVSSFCHLFPIQWLLTQVEVVQKYWNYGSPPRVSSKLLY